MLLLAEPVLPVSLDVPEAGGVCADLISLLLFLLLLSSAKPRPHPKPIPWDLPSPADPRLRRAVEHNGQAHPSERGDSSCQDPERAGLLPAELCGGRACDPGGERDS